MRGGVEGRLEREREREGGDRETGRGGEGEMEERGRWRKGNVDFIPINPLYSKYCLVFLWSLKPHVLNVSHAHRRS